MRLSPRSPVVACLAVVALMVGEATAASAATVAPTTVVFSGSSWAVKTSTGPVGPGPNVFSDSPQNVWVDASGQLHLRITHRDGQWQSAEVVLDHSLGYGTYRFDLASSIGGLDPNVVLGLFTWSDDPAYHHREIDIEAARWGATAADNAQYVVQPSSTAGNLRRFVQPDVAPTSHAFTWTQKSVSFRSASASDATIASWTYTGRSVPRAGTERTRVNLWLAGGVPPTNGAEVEVVLSAFSFTPPATAR